MTDQAHHEGIIEKVRGLLAKAASTTSEAEAESCVRLAHKLLEKHNLDMTAIEMQEAPPAGQERIDTMYTDPWRSAIARGACNLFFCTYFHSHWFDKNALEEARTKWKTKWDAFKAGPGKAPETKWNAETRLEYYRLRKSQPDATQYMRPSFVIVGRPHNRAICISMIEYLWTTTRRLSRDFSKARAEQLAFQRGCGERLASRLNMMAWEARRKAPKQPGTALTIYDDFEAENKAVTDDLGLVKRKSGSSKLDSDAADAGAKAAEGVSLAPQLGAKGGAGAHALPAPPKRLPGR